MYVVVVCVKWWWWCVCGGCGGGACVGGGTWRECGFGSNNRTIVTSISECFISDRWKCEFTALRKIESVRHDL